MTKEKHLIIDEDIHSDIKMYCWVKRIPLKKFVNDKLRTLPELVEFRKRTKKLNY